MMTFREMDDWECDHGKLPRLVAVMECPLHGHCFCEQDEARGCGHATCANFWARMRKGVE